MKSKAQKEKLSFVIEEDLSEVGFYLYVYEDEKCIRDYLQNSVEICKAVAKREFGLEEGAWNDE